MSLRRYNAGMISGMGCELLCYFTLPMINLLMPFGFTRSHGGLRACEVKTVNMMDRSGDHQAEVTSVECDGNVVLVRVPTARHAEPVVRRRMRRPLISHLRRIARADWGSQGVQRIQIEGEGYDALQIDREYWVASPTVPRVCVRGHLIGAYKLQNLVAEAFESGKLAA
jgi:hypothetical protein